MEHFLFHYFVTIAFCCCFFKNLAAISISSVDSCLIQPDSSECTNQPRCCSYIQSTPYALRYPLISFMSLFGQQCKCDDKCKWRMALCINGDCDKKNKKCICKSCYTGQTCESYENKHPPKFTSTKHEITIPETTRLHKEFYQVSAVDRDEKLCIAGQDCPCGTVLFKLKNNLNTFTINQKTGELALKETPRLPKYSIKIVGENDGDISKQTFYYLTIIVSRIENALKHRRRRRAVPDATETALHIEAVPILEDSYYFNKGDEIKFLIRAKHNSTGSSDVTNIELYITSTYLTLHAESSNAFDQAGVAPNSTNQYLFQTATISDGQTFSGNINGTVKDSIGPLTNLYLEMEAQYEFGTNLYGIKDIKSLPIVYGVFPVITVNRTQTGAIEVYKSLAMNMFIELPKLNYNFYVEITTGIEDYVFMSIENVQITEKGTAITYNGSGLIVPYSSQSNDEKDRVSIDFGYLTINDALADDQRNLNISFDIKFGDHPLVADGSTHSFGVGLQAGPSILWVEQHDVEIIKKEPALECEISSYMITNFTRVFIGDKFNLTIKLTHANTSEKDAKDVEFHFYMNNIDVNGVGLIHYIGASTNYTKTMASFVQGSEETFDLELTVKEDITPLIDIPIYLQVDFKNPDSNKQKRPILESYHKLVTGTPLMTLKLNGSEQMIPGQKRTFELTILLTKMRSPLVIELVMPKANGFPILTILSMKVTSIGSNIEGINSSPESYIATLRNSTSNAYMKDQAVLDLGTALNKVDTRDDTENKIEISFETIVNENDNLTTSYEPEFQVGAGVIGKPKMVWVGQVGIHPHILSDEKPVLDFTFNKTLKNDNNVYIFEINIKHASNSSMFAHNITFQYYLPPFIEFIELKTFSSDIEEEGSNTRFKYTPPLLYFTEEISHSIKVRLIPHKSEKTGKDLEYIVPFRLSYSNKRGLRKHFWKRVNGTMNVLRRDPIITKSKEAKAEYYGRGFYYHIPEKTIYVCSNQHTPSSRPACYYSSDGINFRRIDSRIGCIIGHHETTKVLYGLARNQITYMKYMPDEKDWYLVTDKQFETEKTGWTNLNNQFRNIENADTFGVSATPDNAHKLSVAGDKEWIGTGDGLYHKMDAINSDYVQSAKWIRYKL